jgi:hypothetical protein
VEFFEAFIFIGLAFPWGLKPGNLGAIMYGLKPVPFTKAPDLQ